MDPLLELQDVLVEIERIIQVDIGDRGIAPLFQKGELMNATSNAMAASHVAICTGFYIPAYEVPETDGPPGTIAIVRALHVLKKKVTIITDRWSHDVMKGCIDAYIESIQNEAHATDDVITLLVFPHVEGGETEQQFLETHFKPWNPNGVDHLIAIERLGRSRDGTYRNMKGIDVSFYNARLDFLFLSRDPDVVTTTGIGDGGNEIGMGNVYNSVVEFVPGGREIATTVATNSLIACGVSNWGGFALAAGMFLYERLVNGNEEVKIGHVLTSVEEQHEVLDASLRQGAVDGVTGKSEKSVDGMAAEVHDGILEDIRSILVRCITK